MLDLGELEGGCRRRSRSGAAAEKSGKGLDMPDIVVLCLVAKASDRHVRDHASILSTFIAPDIPDGNGRREANNDIDAVSGRSGAPDPAMAG